MMYKHTINPEIIKQFNRKAKVNSWSPDCRYSWCSFLKEQNLIKVLTSKKEEIRMSKYLELTLGWYLHKNFVFYSEEKRNNIPIRGYLVESNILFKVEKVS